MSDDWNTYRKPTFHLEIYRTAMKDRDRSNRLKKKRIKKAYEQIIPEIKWENE